jgi:hypothetical protein
MSVRARTLRVIAELLAGAALAGCSLATPYTPPRSVARPSAGRDAGDPPPERDGTIPAIAAAAQSVLATDAARPSPRATLARYATLAVNWNWRTLPTIERRLAAISLDQARAQALQAAATATSGPTLSQHRITNRGRVLAIAADQARPPGWWVIVTTETTTAQTGYSGLPPTLHVTYAHVAHIHGGWVVNQWQPQT